MHSLALAYLNAVEVHIVFNDVVFFSFRAAIVVAFSLKSLRIVCDYMIDINYPLLSLPFSRQEILVHLSQTSSACADLRSINENSSSRGK